MKKVPLRKCTGCGEMKPKRELIRVVRLPSEDAAPEIRLDLTGKLSGRGAYVCQNPECLRLARKARRLERSLSCRIPEEIYERLENELTAAGADASGE